MKRGRQQNGIVSIMVTMTMIVVISLIVLGFATVSRNEQRSTADNQLSTQAYYAAESGINDARAAIDNFASKDQLIPAKTSCADDAVNYPGLVTSKIIDAAHNISYSCVLISSVNRTLSYALSFASTVIPLNSSTGVFKTVTLTWSAGAGNPASTSNCNATPGKWPTTWNCSYPVLRIDMVNMDTGGALSRSSWINNTATMFLVPEQGGGKPNINFTPGMGNVQIVPVPCKWTGPCSIDIKNLQGLNSQHYYLRASTLYVNNTRLAISSKTPGQMFTGAQAQIDVTGKAQDVLRRLLVAIDLTNTAPIPDYALMSTDSICKRYQITSNSFSVPKDPAMQNPAGADGDLLCG